MYLLRKNIIIDILNSRTYTVCISNKKNSFLNGIFIRVMNPHGNFIKRGRYDQGTSNYDNDCLSNLTRNVRNISGIPLSSPIRVSCGELRSEDVGKSVEVVGKMIHQKMGRFVHLKDSSGTIQLIVPEHRTDLAKRFVNMPMNSYISVTGLVMHRPGNSKNEKMVTGDVEIVMHKFEMVKVNRSSKIDLNHLTVFASRSFSTNAHSDLALTAEEYRLCNGFKYYEQQLKQRSVTCGSLDNISKNETVEIMGWAHRLMLPKFLQLKDGYGVVQCVLNDDQKIQSLAKDLKSDTLIRITGKVSSRPDSCINMNVPTGKIEIIVKSLSIVDPNDSSQDSSHIETEAETDADCNGVNSNCWRTHTCGELRTHRAGERVKLYGWLEHHRMNKFFTLRDAYGSTQCILNENGPADNLFDFQTLQLESILEVEGVVASRPDVNLNPAMPTGCIEVVVDKIKVLNPATFHPFQIRSFQKAKESLRMQYRYLDLRFSEMQKNIRLRSDITMKMRKYLSDEHNFVEVETPTLFCRTPGGAQEFVVPTRHQGMFYSLVQSPQQFKQILMAGSIDRYYQIARCYRDECIHGDRQPEFTQLDVEMSFAGREEILNLMEGLLRKCWPGNLPSIIPRLTYKEVMEKYGTDKPDLTINCDMKNVTHILKQDPKNNQEDFIALAILLKRLHIGKSFKTSLVDIMHKQPQIKGFIRKVPTNFNGISEFINAAPLETHLSKQLVEHLGIKSDDWLILAYGSWEDTCLCMGKIRSELGRHLDTRNDLVNEFSTDIKPLWVVDFPLFVKGDEGIQTCHHPFTAPHPEDVHLLDSEPLKVRSLAYDLVINGNEVGGGSVRAHDVELQKKLLNILKIPEEPLSHLLQALASGCPPHAGIALGLDRFIALACKAPSIRDVIAFPKSVEGRDLLSGAPSHISQHDMDIYHIDVKK